MRFSGVKLLCKEKAIKRLPFIFQASEPTEDPSEDSIKHFLLPLYSVVKFTITDKKSKINTVWSKIFYFESKRVKMCLQLYVTMISS